MDFVQTTSVPVGARGAQCIPFAAHWAHRSLLECDQIGPWSFVGWYALAIKERSPQLMVLPSSCLSEGAVDCVRIGLMLHHRQRLVLDLGCRRSSRYRPRAILQPRLVFKFCRDRPLGCVSCCCQSACLLVCDQSYLLGLPFAAPSVQD